MLTQTILVELARHLSSALEKNVRIENAFAVSGGDINTCYRLQSNVGDYFVKTQFAPWGAAMFQAEWVGLAALAQCKALKVPQPVALGAVGERHFLIMEALDLQDSGDESVLARALAQLHEPRAQQFGWGANNFIGSNVQYNTPANSWREFWWECRLQPQMELAYSNGYAAQLKPYARALQAASDHLLGTHNPQPSLVHGDLWRSNTAYLDLQPCVFDPACYWGDREVDLAMTRLFGGFPPQFYTAYNKAWALPAGYEQRQPLYNLYHLLNHLNQFGCSYLRQCLTALESITVRAAKSA